MASVTFDNATRLYPGGTRPAAVGVPPVDVISLEAESPVDGAFVESSLDMEPLGKTVRVRGGLWSERASPRGRRPSRC